MQMCWCANYGLTPHWTFPTASQRHAVGGWKAAPPPTNYVPRFLKKQLIFQLYYDIGYICVYEGTKICMYVLALSSISKQFTILNSYSNWHSKAVSTLTRQQPAQALGMFVHEQQLTLLRLPASVCLQLVFGWVAVRWCAPLQSRLYIAGYLLNENMHNVNYCIIKPQIWGYLAVKRV